MKKILRYIAKYSFIHHKLTLSVVFLLTAISLFLTSRLELRTNFVQLLPQKSRIVKVFFQSVTDFGMSDFFIIRLKTETNINPDQMMELADNIVENLQDCPLIEYIDYRLGDKEKDFYKTIFLRNMTLFVDSNGLKSLANALSNKEIISNVRKNRELLFSQVSLGVKKNIVNDPLHLLQITKDYLPGQKGNLKFDLSDGYYFTHNHKMLIIMIKPTKPFSDFNFDKNLLQTVQSAVDKAVKVIKNETISEKEQLESINVGFTGGHVITLADKDVIKKDIIRTVVSSFFGIILLFLFAFRRWETLIYIGLPLIIGVIWTLGFSYITIGNLNLITSVLAAIIMGLGVDFAIHLYNRYLNERNENKSVQEALEISLSETGLGTLTGALTTAAAFFAMMIAPFKGLSEFGFMAGSGILLCYLSVIVTLPALIKINLSFHNEKHFSFVMRSPSLNSISNLAMKYPVFTLVIGLLVVIAAFTQIPKISFSDSLVSLRAQSNKYMKVRDEIRTSIGGSLRYFLIVLRGPDEKTLLENNDRLVNRLKTLVHDGRLTAISSIDEYIPPLKRQIANIKQLQDNSVEFNPERIEKTFYAALIKNGFRIVPAYKKYMNNLNASLTVKKPFTYNYIQKIGLQRLLRRFIKFKRNEIRMAIYLFPKEKTDSSEVHDMETLIKDINAIFKELNINADITGALPVTQTLKRGIINSINNVSALAFFCVIVVLAAHFRKLRLIIAALLPMTVGIILMLGSMPLINLSLNFFNIAIIPIIVGIGIDDGVHIIHRYRETEPRDLGKAMKLSGKAVVMTSLTTIMAFGSLYFSDYRGLSAMGYLAITGVGFSLLSTITLLPALITVKNRIKNGKINT